MKRDKEKENVKYYYKYKSKSGFTLAETLITIVVVGIVAALTVPSLIARYKNEQIDKQLKKSYSTLANGIKMSEISNGPMKNWPIGADVGNVTEDYWKTYFQPFFRDAKLCTNSINCGYKTNLSHSKWQDAQWSIETTSSRLLFQFSDGTVIFYPIYTSANGVSIYVDSVYIDVNGTKNPNTYCKDVFKFRKDYTKGSIIPVECTINHLKNVEK